MLGVTPGVIFMDHTMFMHNPRLAAMSKVVHDSKHAVNRVRGVGIGGTVGSTMLMTVSQLSFRLTTRCLFVWV